MNKEKFFYRPNTIGEILEDRRVLMPSRSELVQTLETMSDAQAVRIDYTLVPNGYGYEEDQFRNGPNFMKRGPQVNLYEPKSVQEALERRLGPTRLRIDAFDNLDSEQDNSAYSWRGLRTGQKRRVHLVDCLEGSKLFAFSERSKLMQDKITMRTYKDACGIEQQGGVFTFEVPSRSSESKHLVRLHSVPLPRSGTEYAVWFDLASVHACADKLNRFSFRYASKEENFCAHDVAAYLHLAKQVYQQSGRVILMPFALPTELTVGFYGKLRNNVVLKDNRGKKKRRPLNNAEIEILLWELVANKQNKATFFARKKMQELEW